MTECARGVSNEPVRTNSRGYELLGIGKRHTQRFGL